MIDARLYVRTAKGYRMLRPRISEPEWRELDGQPYFRIVLFALVPSGVRGEVTHAAISGIAESPSIYKRKVDPATVRPGDEYVLRWDFWPGSIGPRVPPPIPAAFEDAFR